MKQKLILLQPKKFNELFSTYHTKRNLNLKSKVNLPKISAIFSNEWDTASSTKRINNTSSNSFQHSNINFSSTKKGYLFDRNKEFFYPIEPQTKGFETSRNLEFLPYPSIKHPFKKIVDIKSKEKKKIENKSTDLKMIYLKLLKEENDKNDYMIDSMINKSDEDEIIKNDFINKRIIELNKDNKKKLNKIFNQTEQSKLRADLSMVQNIPVVLINLYAQDLYNTFYNNKYGKSNLKKFIKNRFNDNSNMENLLKTFNVNINQKNKYINNEFFSLVLDNVKHKIEVIDQHNKKITVLYVKNLINDEINYIQNEFFSYKRHYYTENSQFTSNNMSKFTNYEYTSKNTFKFRTNNTSTKDNDNVSTNNNSSVLGSLINNMYSKKYGGKKRKFETMNTFHNVDPNKFFQNKEIISSIKKDKTETNKDKNKFRNISDKINQVSDEESEIYNKSNLTSISVDHVHNRIRSKFRHGVKKKLVRTFSEVFLYKNYRKASDYINEISDDIERKYLLRRRRMNIDDDEEYSNSIEAYKAKKAIKNMKRKLYRKHLRNNIFKYEEDKESFLFSPKDTIGTNTNIQFKFHNDQNNESSTKNINDEKTKDFFAPNKIDLNNIISINNQNSLSKGNSLNYFYDNNKNSILNDKKNRNLNKNLDLKNIKSTKSSNGNLYNSNKTIFNNQNGKTISNINNKRSSVKNSMKNKRNVTDFYSNEILNKINKKSNKGEDTDESEESEDDDGGDEEVDEGDNEKLTDEDKNMKKLMKAIQQSKKKKKLEEFNGLNENDGSLTISGIEGSTSRKNNSKRKSKKKRKSIKFRQSIGSISNKKDYDEEDEDDDYEDDDDFDESIDFEDPEILKQMKKFNVDKDEFMKIYKLTNNKKKNKIYGSPKDKRFRNSKIIEPFTLLDENDELLNEKHEKRSEANYDRDEEIRILKEIEEFDEALNLDEKQNMIKEMLELRNLINDNSKDKDIKDKINSRRLSLFNVVNKFFENWIKKDISLKIVDFQKYKNKLDKLEYIQFFRIYSLRNLKLLESKYILPYIENEERKKRDEEIKKAKSIRKKMADEEFKKFKLLVEEKRKRKDLIFDNSYLFKKGKIKNFKLRKEVEEILNTDYGLYYLLYHEDLKELRKIKKKRKKKKKGNVIKVGYQRGSILTNEEMTQKDKEEQERRLRLLKEEEDKEKLEELKEKRLYDFFSRIQRLKNGKIKNFEEELNQLIDEQLELVDNTQQNKESRMNYFLQEFQFNRLKSKYNSDYKTKRISYLSPLKFKSDNLK